MLKGINERRKTALLAVEHNVKSLFEIADRAYVLDKGKVVAHGPPHDLFTSGIFEKVFLGHIGR